MGGEAGLRRVAPEELPVVLRGLDPEETTEFALVGPSVSVLSAPPEEWPEELRGRVVYQLTGELSGLPGELLRLERLELLTLWALGLGNDDIRAIAEHLGRLTSLALSYNQVGEAGARAIAEHLGRLTTLNLSNNQVGEAGARAIAEHLGRLTTLDQPVELGQLTSLDQRGGRCRRTGDCRAPGPAHYTQPVEQPSGRGRRTGDCQTPGPTHVTVSKRQPSKRCRRTGDCRAPGPAHHTASQRQPSGRWRRTGGRLDLSTTG